MAKIVSSDNRLQICFKVTSLYTHNIHSLRDAYSRGAL